MPEGRYLQRGVAEFVGTFALVFVGAGSLIYGNIVGTALAYGLVVAVMVTSLERVSGGHFNPAVTLGFLATRRISPALAAVYWLEQIAGATLAALLLKWVLPSQTSSLHVGAPEISSAIDPAKAVAIEGLLTFFLVWVVFATLVDPDGAFVEVAGLAIGLTVTFDVLMAGGLTGGIVNPARSIGPELASGHWSHFWIWLVGPLAGGVVAALVYDTLFIAHDPVEPPPVETAAPVEPPLAESPAPVEPPPPETPATDASA